MSARIAFDGYGSIAGGSRVDAVFTVRRPCTECHVGDVRLHGPCSCDDGMAVVEVYADELDADEVAWLLASGDVNACAVWQRWGVEDDAPTEEGRAA